MRHSLGNVRVVCEHAALERHGRLPDPLTVHHRAHHVQRCSILPHSIGSCSVPSLCRRLTSFLVDRTVPVDCRCSSLDGSVVVCRTNGHCELFEFDSSCEQCRLENKASPFDVDLNRKRTSSTRSCSESLSRRVSMSDASVNELDRRCYGRRIQCRVRPSTRDIVATTRTMAKLVD
jgi:hypothetical protein